MPRVTILQLKKLMIKNQKLIRGRHYTGIIVDDPVRKLDYNMQKKVIVGYETSKQLIKEANMRLTFEELRKANKNRSDEVYFPINGWSLIEWSNALAGEVGELCNLTKKHMRDTVENKTLICDELADVVIYADLLA